MKILQSSGVPIYQQIAEQMKEDNINPLIKANEFLPSIRGLAKDLKISVITTMKAYDELADEGYVTAIQGKGYMINPQDTEMMREQHLRRVEAGLMDAIKASRLAGIGAEELKQMLDFLQKKSEGLQCCVTLDDQRLVHIQVKDRNQNLLQDVLFPMGFPERFPIVTNLIKGIRFTGAGWSTETGSIALAFEEYYNLHEI